MTATAAHEVSDFIRSDRQSEQARPQTIAALSGQSTRSIRRSIQVFHRHT